MPEVPPLTAKDLLPAIIELASIQADLLATLERPRAGLLSAIPPPRVERGGLGAFDESSLWQPDPVPIDTGRLRLRSRELLAWLLDAFKQMDQL